VVRCWPKCCYAVHDCIPASYLCPCKSRYPVIFRVLSQFLTGWVRIVPQIKSWLEDLSLLESYTVLLGWMLTAFQRIKVASSSGSCCNTFLLGLPEPDDVGDTIWWNVRNHSPHSPNTQHNILQDSSPLQHHHEKFKSCTGYGRCRSHPFQFTICQLSYHLTIHNQRDFMCGWVHQKYAQGMGHSLVPKLVGLLEDFASN